MEKELVSKLGQCFSRMLDKKAEHLVLKQVSARVKIDPTHFISLEKANTSSSSSSLAPVCFVDGGNAEILGSSTFSLQLIRLGAVLFKGKKRVKSVRKECFVLIRLDGEEYRTEIFGDSLFGPSASFLFSLSEKSLRSGEEDVKPSSIGNALRRYAELAFAEELVRKEEISCLTLDGSLALRYPSEKKFFSGLIALAGEKKTEVVFLSKSTAVHGDNNLPASYCLLKRAPDSAWLYPCGQYSNEGVGYSLDFVHLHQRSSYVFLAETVGRNRDAIPALVQHCADPAFLGYPYGLVVADQIARISKEETATLQAYFLEKMKKEKTHLTDFSLLLHDAHSILDSMRF